ncbi:hypothetical protein M9H77_20255 [Catharanthus roseus]|uniref:Uncharacterized protein n=2 Tax=Catharanthus roseus TaxID=4058 RepID=A0ACC0ALQ8_CATRO|nr:hypothetical protein M9H77_20253 [Catharanthus roseus]KAI5660932.1 hypothetical protein M9H77_20255 [Catharanthus roseus]
MANSSTAAKTSYHTRSISLPSRAHPQTSSLEDQLCRLKSSSTASTSSSEICHNLGLLNDLYESFDDLLQSPHAQQALSQNQQTEKCLDGSLKLLDICSMTKDAFLIIKESLQNIESSIRRKKSTGESAHADEVQNFQLSRKNVKRIVKKCFTNMRQMESCKIKMENGKQNSENVALLGIMREVEAVSLPILQSILAFVFGTETKSFLSKLISSKQTGNQGQVMEKMEKALETLKGQNTQKIELQSIELVIQELEEGLECLFRRLLKSRVSLLNMLNH